VTPDKATALREAARDGAWAERRKRARGYSTAPEEAKISRFRELADPPTILDLLAERERLRGALESAAKRMDHCRRHIESGQVVDKDVHGALCRGRDAARQALEATDD
jgi:hypothetical protein